VPPHAFGHVQEDPGVQDVPCAGSVIGHAFVHVPPKICQTPVVGSQ
jgi:hypothetical protein